MEPPILFLELAAWGRRALVRDVRPPVPSESLGSRPGSGVTGRDREVRGATHNWPSVVRVREGLVGRDL